MIKLLIFVIILISYNIYAQYESKDENRIIDTSDQIIILYNLAKKNIEDKEFKKSLKLLKALSRRDDLGSYEIENRTQTLCQNFFGFSLLAPLNISKMRTDENIIKKPTHSLIDSN